METFCEAKELIPDPDFKAKKIRALRELTRVELDQLMVEPVARLNRLPFCYTVQSCHGHILGPPEPGATGWRRLPVETPPDEALYQLAYVAVVVNYGMDGRSLLAQLAQLVLAAPAMTQFGSAEWFWSDQGQINSYVLQVSPRRHARQDRFKMRRAEAFEWLEARRLFLEGLDSLG